MSKKIIAKILGKIYEFDPRDYTKEDIDKELRESEAELKKVQVRNAAWNADFNKICQLREEARDCEKWQDYERAINLYEQSVVFGELSDRMKLNSYVFDIERLIILYGKTKQTEALIGFLKESIVKYPKCKEAKKWRERLKKIQSKNKKTK